MIPLKYRSKRSEALSLKGCGLWTVTLRLRHISEKRQTLWRSNHNLPNLKTQAGERKDIFFQGFCHVETDVIIWIWLKSTSTCEWCTLYLIFICIYRNRYINIYRYRQFWSFCLLGWSWTHSHPIFQTCLPLSKHVNINYFSGGRRHRRGVFCIDFHHEGQLCHEDLGNLELCTTIYFLHAVHHHQHYWRWQKGQTRTGMSISCSDRWNKRLTGRKSSFPQ